MRRIFAGMIASLFLAVVLAGNVAPAAVQAASLPAGATVSLTTMAAGCGKPKLLGIFVPWYQYLELEKDPVTKDCGVKDFNVLPGGGKGSDILLILLAVVDDLLRLAGLAAVAYVIYGGIQYATSQGEPDATARAQSTIINALVGLVIAITAVAFVTYLGRALT